MPKKISRSTWRLIALFVSMPAAVLVFGFIYMFGATYLEGRPTDFWSSLEWASETLTTTGYGAYAPWKHPVMILLVILTQFVGMFFLVLVFPVYVLPYIEERFEMRLPHALPPMTGRVLFYRYGPAIDSLLEEFQRVGSAFVIFEEDVTLARSLRDRGHYVVFGKLDEEPAGLAGVNQARAIVANADDHANATCILMARELGFDGPIYALWSNLCARRRSFVSAADAEGGRFRRVHANPCARRGAGGSRQHPHQSTGRGFASAQRAGWSDRIPGSSG